MLESKLSVADDEIKTKEDAIKLKSEEINSLKKRMCDNETLMIGHTEQMGELNNKIACLEKDNCLLRSELNLKTQHYEDVVSKLNICRQDVDLHLKKEFESRNKVNKN
jgi:chromosome segregation ATPase